MFFTYWLIVVMQYQTCVNTNGAFWPTFFEAQQMCAAALGG